MATWQSSTGYSVGDKVDRSTPGLFEFIAMNDGTSGEVEPDWNEGTDALTVDGAITWLAVLYSLDSGQSILLEYQRRQRGAAMGIRRRGLGL